MIGVELAGSMVVEDDVDSSLVRLCDRPFGLLVVLCKQNVSPLVAAEI
jgi:hypothetical protein